MSWVKGIWVDDAAYQQYANQNIFDFAAKNPQLVPTMAKPTYDNFAIGESPIRLQPAAISPVQGTQTGLFEGITGGLGGFFKGLFGGSSSWDSSEQGGSNMNQMLLMLMLLGGKMNMNTLLMLMMFGGMGSSDATSPLSIGNIMMAKALKGTRLGIPLLAILGLVPPTLMATSALIGTTARRRRTTRTRVIYRNRYIRRRY